VSKRVATLLAYDFFVIESRNLFVIYGDMEIEDNTEVKAGMSVHIVFNPTFSVSETIHSVEYVLKKDKEYIGICLKYDDPEEMEFVKALNIGDETCEIYSA
jgi:hypothetical protein